MRVVMVCNSDGALYFFRRPIIEALVRQGHQVFTISPESRYFEGLRAIGAVPIERNFSRHSTDVLGNLKLMFGIWQALKRLRPDVVHSFTHKPAIYASIAARLLGVRRIFVTVTGLGTLFTQSNFGTTLLRTALLLQYGVALWFVRRTFFQNPDDCQYFVSRRLVAASKAVVTNGSGIDLDLYKLPGKEDVAAARLQVGTELGLSFAGRKVVLFPARGVKDKGFFEFYEAARLLSKDAGNDYAFLHLGFIDEESTRGIGASSVAEFAKACGVLHLGFKEDIRPYLACSDIVVLPSYREGTPRSLIEGLAFGKVIITTDAPGCKETVVEGWNGYLCPVGDAISLAHKIDGVSAAFTEAARDRSRKLCEEKYDSRKLVDLTMACYEPQPIA